ncbi:MAG TPA: NUDIX domain-containing protein [Kribbella sp.]|uniref:NUDIX domain-containing protein n=1 Tax=Kribbella sp. TaxID=1871183 RepID=UPI002D77D914|nr:NUDIX domain-containing protein [Kribbella sp.]HET6297598.1 NUDIX domain-containing protein [Kribbella sp.]
MVRERVQTAPGRHDGPEYWTLPGGGIEADEEPEVAVRREVLEEVGLEVVSARGFAGALPVRDDHCVPGRGCDGRAAARRRRP